MKSLIIYCSEYKGHTKKIAEVFAKEAGAKLINIRDIGNIDIENYDLIGFGSGVYKESMSPKLFRVVEKLNLKGKNIFVFSTSGVGMDFYNKKLIKLILSKGGVNKGSFACKGSFVAKEFTNVKLFDIMGKFSQGHPNNKDITKAEKFIKKVLESL